MPYKVLVVDDSSFFRRRVTDIINSDPQLEVIDVAVNGKEAVEKVASLKPDVVTMDVEMPVLNGIDAVKQIMAKSPTSILMFSSLTHQGAKATFDALEAGALDFLPKKFDEIARNNEDAVNLLKQRVVQLAKRGGSFRKPLATTRPTSLSQRSAVSPIAESNSKERAPISRPVKRSGNKSYKLVAIGTSTGGPVALQKILTQFPAGFKQPIILVQHMPAAFTPAFAKRLDSLCKITIKQAENGESLKPGVAYLAPGGKQMLIDGTENAPKLRVLDDNSARVAYKPSVDISFGSAAKVFNGDVLAVVLTGMGADGREGSRMLKAKGATIWAQDEATCVVYGMPAAVTSAGLSEMSLPLNDVASSIIKESGNG